MKDCAVQHTSINTDSRNHKYLQFNTQENI